MRLLRNALVVAAISSAVACSSSKGTAPDAGPDAGPTACTDATPCALTPGAVEAGDIGVVGQVDTYTIDVPSSMLLKISLTNIAPVTPVKLVFILESGDGTSVLGTRGPQTATGLQSLLGYFLIPSAGTYRIIVRDSLNTHSDAHNGYSLTASLLADPDQNEPDNTIAQARPLTLSSTPAQIAGSVAYTGDIDLAAFTVQANNTLVRLQVTQAASSGSLQLRARLLEEAAGSNSTNLASASTIIEVNASAPGAALAEDVTRALQAGTYVIAIDDLSGLGADPATQWTATITQVPDPDPNEQTTRNDTSATATKLNVGSTLQGAIGSQGDLDWYEVDLPASSTTQLLQLTLDPMMANQSLELTWAVGDLLTTPTSGCPVTCGPSAFCVSGSCAYDEHANHHFMSMETTPQTVRIRHLGQAEVVRIVVEDFGDLQFSSSLYSISAAMVTEPDTNELTAFNDTVPMATPVDYANEADGGLSFTSMGAIDVWDVIDSVTPADSFADLDWYQLALPPRMLAPNCPLPDAGQLPDGGFNDAGDNDAGLLDGGACQPYPYDGGLVYEPRPDYGLVVHWHDPSDKAYTTGVQGQLELADGGPACVFSFGESQARAETTGAGAGFVYGNLASDLCFCVAGSEADQLWFKMESVDRKMYSSDPYGFEVELNPDGLQTACDGGCAPLTHASACPP